MLGHLCEPLAGKGGMADLRGRISSKRRQPCLAVVLVLTEKLHHPRRTLVLVEGILQRVGNGIARLFQKRRGAALGANGI